MSDVARVEHYFTRSAELFDSLYHSQPARPAARWLNRTFRRDIYERFRLSLQHIERCRLQSVLDVGCGSGRYAVALSEIGVPRVLGLDVSPGMIKLARELTIGSNGEHTSVEFVQQDFAAFETSERFDAVMAMGFFDYAADPLAALVRMRRFARHSVIASLPSISWYRTPIRKARYWAKRCPVYFYRRAEIDRLAQGCGFARHEITKIEGAGQDYFVAFFL